MHCMTCAMLVGSCSELQCATCSTPAQCEHFTTECLHGKYDHRPCMACMCHVVHGMHVPYRVWISPGRTSKVRLGGLDAQNKPCCDQSLQQGLLLLEHSPCSPHNEPSNTPTQEKERAFRAEHRRKMQLIEPKTFLRGADRKANGGQECVKDLRT